MSKKHQNSKKERRRYRPGEAHAGKGRPPTPPHLSPNYKRKSLSLPEVGFKNLDELAELGNTRARSGPNYGQTAWRSWQHRFAMVDAPRIIKMIKDLGLTWQGWDCIHLTIELDPERLAAIRREEMGLGDADTNSDGVEEESGTLHDRHGGGDAEANRQAEGTDGQVELPGDGSVVDGHRGGSGGSGGGEVPEPVLESRKPQRKRRRGGAGAGQVVAATERSTDTA